MVEFGLIAPIFFALLFGIIEGALAMFVINSGNYSAGVGVVEAAAAGDRPNADTTIVANIRKSSVAVTGLVRDTQVYIYLVSINNKTGSPAKTIDSLEQCAASQTTCNAYDVASGNVIEGLNNWTPAQRQPLLTSQTAPNTLTSMIGITLSYKYRPLTVFGPTVSLTATKYSRFEPCLFGPTPPVHTGIVLDPTPLPC